MLRKALIVAYGDILWGEAKNELLTEWYACIHLHGSCKQCYEFVHNYSQLILIAIHMENLFQKFVYTSVGLVSLTVDKFQKSVEKLVTEDKISQEEGKRIMDDLFKNTEAKREEFEAKLKSLVEEVLARMNVGSASQVAELQERLKAVEEKLGIVHEAQGEQAESKKKAPKKVAVEA